MRRRRVGWGNPFWTRFLAGFGWKGRSLVEIWMGRLLFAAWFGMLVEAWYRGLGGNNNFAVFSIDLTTGWDPVWLYAIDLPTKNNR